MSRLHLSLLAAVAASALTPALAVAGGCCVPAAEPKVIYAAPPPPDYAPGPVIQSYQVNLGPYITGLNLDAEGYPPTYYYPSQPARHFPYLRGDEFWYAAWPYYDRPAPRYRPVHPGRRWSGRSPAVWK